MKKTLNIHFELNNECFLSCRFCYNKFFNRDEGYKELNFTKLVEFINLFEDIKEIKFYFVGGEPLLKFDRLKKIIDNLKKEFKNKINFYIFTNLVRISPEFIRLILKYKLTIFVNADNLISGTNIEQIKKNLFMLREKLPANLWKRVFFTVVLSANHKDICKSLDKLINYGSNNILIKFPFFTPSKLSLLSKEDTAYIKESVKKLVSRCIKIIEQGDTIKYLNSYFSVFNFYLLYLLTDKLPAL